MEVIWHLLDIGASIAVIGVGYYLGKSSKPKPYEEPKPICGCKHHYSYHAGEDGICHAWTDNYNQYVCGCQKYVGPEPLPEVIP